MTQTKTLYDIVYIYIYRFMTLYIFIYIIYIYMGVGVGLGVTTSAFDDGSAVQECAQEGGVGLGEGRCERAPRGVEEEGRPPQGFE